MLENLMMGFALWTLASVVIGLIAGRAMTFHVREDRPLQVARARHKLQP